MVAVPHDARKHSTGIRPKHDRRNCLRTSDVTGYNSWLSFESEQPSMPNKHAFSSNLLVKHPRAAYKLRDVVFFPNRWALHPFVVAACFLALAIGEMSRDIQAAPLVPDGREVTRTFRRPDAILAHSVAFGPKKDRHL